MVAAEPGKGALVAFFAAQTDETTPEKNMPPGKIGRKPQGVFTYTIFQALAEHPGITYRQLAQEVLRLYSVKNLTRTTPMFAGDLDRVVFGAEATARVAQWPVETRGDGAGIRAGRLYGLAEGMKLAVMASPADATADALGWVTVTGLDTFSAQVAGADGYDAAAIPKGAVLRKVADEIDYTLTVALPEGDGAPAEAMRAAAAALEQDGMGTRLRFVPPGAEADLRLAVLPDSPRPDAIWILPATGLVEAGYAATPSVSTGDKTVEELAAVIGDDFGRMARALNLMKIGAASGGGAGLAVTAELRRARFDPATEAVDEASRGPVDTGNVPRMAPNDVVVPYIENRTDGPVDYNILYVGSDYSISFIANGRMNPGEKVTTDENAVLISDRAYGRDRMIVVLSPAVDGTEIEDLSFLEQDALTMARGTPDETGRDIPGIIDGSEAHTDLESLLGEAGFGRTTRAAVGLKSRLKAKTAAPEILQFEIDTVPAGG